MAGDQLIRVWYWVRGSGLGDVTSIQIPVTATIQDLQRGIKEELGLSLLPRLYKILDTDAVKLADGCPDAIGKLCISKLGALFAYQTVVGIPIRENYLHIVVDSQEKELSLCCWRRGGALNANFVVDLTSDMRIYPAVVEGARKRWRSLSNVATDDDLCFFQVRPKNSSEMAQFLENSPKGEFIDSQLTMGKACDKIPFSEILCLVMEIVPSSKPAALPMLAPGMEETSVAIRRAWVRQNPPDAPSTLSDPQEFSKRQSNPRNAIPCGRPRLIEDPIMCTLLHPAFGEFVDDIKDVVLTPEDYIFTLELADVMARIYDNKRSRTTAVFDIFAKHGFATLQGVQIPGTLYQVDGQLCTGLYSVVLVEVKNEVGIAGEPYFQILRYYLEATRKFACDADKPNWPLPCFLLSIFGPYISIAAGTWNERPAAQVLCMPISFALHSQDSVTFDLVARHMVALRRGIRKLERYYDTIQVSSSTSHHISSELFPYMNEYASLVDDGKVHTVIYQKRMATYSDSLVFFGRDVSSEGAPICIKFVRRYSQEAHETCASLGCAPTLRGFRAVPGSWLMVVMDDLSYGYEMLSRQSVTPTLQSLIRGKLLEMHSKGFVHGDIRRANIMVSNTDENDFRFVDFDWSGRTDVTRYPLIINKTDMWRPEEVVGGGLILPQHDLAMLDNLVL